MIEEYKIQKLTDEAAKA